MISPTNNNSFLTNSGILISAIASDADNALTRVELYSQASTNNAQPILLSSINNAPFNYTWNGATLGAYTLTARAYDSFGLIVTSTPVLITVTPPPSTNPPLFLFSSTNFSVNESSPTVSITVLNNGDFGGIVSYQTFDGTAFGGSGYSGSYTIAQGALNFAAGQHSTNFIVGIRVNFFKGPDLLFSVLVFIPSAGALGVPFTTTVTIHQYDAGGSTYSLLTTAAPTAQPAANGLLGHAHATRGRRPVALPGDLAWRNSGDTVSNLVAGNYPLAFRNVPNYVVIPLAGPVAVTNNATALVTNQYLPSISGTNTGGTGSITVNISPNAPAGSGWRFLGETTFRPPGSSASGLLPDLYYIEFAPVSGYATPGSEGISAVAGQTEILTANYQLSSAPPVNADLPTQVSPANITDLIHFPYGFNGQLHTDDGYGSGVAVRETVVLTAAHMVFDDATLAYVQQAYWSFQEEIGVFESEPQPARGWVPSSAVTPPSAPTTSKSPALPLTNPVPKAGSSMSPPSTFSTPLLAAASAATSPLTLCPTPTSPATV